ncbi:hypothetical protein MKZ38_003924 [Zalerion maritima]|uniref:Uncharacterized protein n=1 Tax=Zalerion maritima TaxID=339359 RepID=A0AAD5RN98_9PEZI|nr:hypothetical protein MKZ38_003924 [Zalerion maritima]
MASTASPITLKPLIGSGKNICISVLPTLLSSSPKQPSAHQSVIPNNETVEQRYFCRRRLSVVPFALVSASGPSSSLAHLRLPPPFVLSPFLLVLKCVAACCRRLIIWHDTPLAVLLSVRSNDLNLLSYVYNNSTQIVPDGKYETVAVPPVAETCSGPTLRKPVLSDRRPDMLYLARPDLRVPPCSAPNKLVGVNQSRHERRGGIPGLGELPQILAGHVDRFESIILLDRSYTGRPVTMPHHRVGPVSSRALGYSYPACPPAAAALNLFNKLNSILAL